MTVAKFRLVLVAVLSSAVLLSVSPAQAEGPNAVESLSGCATNTLGRTDDGSTGAVPIGFSANFYGSSYTHLYVNNNGSVSFNSAVGAYTPFDFSVTGDPVIAPFLADVDTLDTGSGVVTYGQTIRDGKQAFCVNWLNVGYFSQNTDKLNSFQLLLVKQGVTGDFDIVLNYDKVQWEAGDSSGGSDGLGGTSALVGYSSGDGDPAHFFFRDGSNSNGALLDSNSVTGLTHGSHGTAQLGRYVFQVQNGAPATGSTLTGTVSDSDGYSVAGAPVEICPASGHCATRFSNASGVYRAVNVAAGNYTVVAHAPGYPSYNGKAGPVAVSGAVATFPQDVSLGSDLEALPAGTTITSVNDYEGIPIVYWDDPLTLATTACAGASTTYQISIDGVVVRSGSMTESSSGNYTSSLSALKANHGFGLVEISVDCPGPATDLSIPFGIIIQPSGYVHEAGTGLPIDGASVKLLRSYSPSGPFIPVPSGNALMSQGNQNNSSTTEANGRFGWDLLAGYYKMRATAAGYGSAESSVFDIPPAPSSIDLQLTRQYELYVGTLGYGSGTVVSSQGGINCGSSCSALFDFGAQVTLTATPAAGSAFTGWSGAGCSGTGICQVTISNDAEVDATFQQIYNISVRKLGSGSGTVTSSPAGINCGSTCGFAFALFSEVTLTATPAPDSTFTGWPGSDCSDAISSCRIDVYGDESFAVEFTKKPVSAQPGAPQTKIVKARLNAAKRTAIFKFSGSGGRGKLSFQCALDKKRFSSCRSPRTYKGLKRGKHTFRVRARDARGKVDLTPAIKKFKI